MNASNSVEKETALCEIGSICIAALLNLANIMVSCLAIQCVTLKPRGTASCKTSATVQLILTHVLENLVHSCSLFISTCDDLRQVQSKRLLQESLIFRPNLGRRGCGRTLSTESLETRGQRQH